MSRQLPLGIELRESASFDAFITRGNEQLVDQLRAGASGKGEPLFYLWGASGTGKSHLLQAACQQASASGCSVIYLPLGTLTDITPSALEALGDMDLVCLDDLQAVAGDEEWEEALFLLFNQLRDRAAGLMVSADLPPARLQLQLPDLRSRLGWGLCYQLHPLDDEGRHALLTHSARKRGMTLPRESANYILRHAPRDPRSLLEIVQQLDSASLAAQRRLTIPFVKSVIEGIHRPPRSP
jgi:DnaA family protein